MGFWSSFFGHAAANAYNEMKKDERETQKWNDLFHELGEYETRFQNYLESIGCPDVYIADVEYVNSGNIIPAKREMDKLRRKCEEYISLGGQGKYLYRLEDIDEAIETIKYLKKMGCLHRQEEFVGLGMVLAQDQLERELREDKGVQILLKTPGNELTNPISQNDFGFVPYDDNSGNVIKIDVAQVYDEDIIEFLHFKTIALKFTQNNIFVYSYDDHANMYYSTTIGENTEVIVGCIPIPAVQGWGLADINGLQVMFSLESIEKVKEFYYSHNISIIQRKEDMQQTGAENINQLSGVEFERVCQQLVEKMGFETETTKASGDGGIDLIAYNHQPLLSGKYIIQCKRYSGSVGEPIIRDLYGVVMSERANKGILMTTGYFTKSAISFAEGKPIELIAGKEVQELLIKYNIGIIKDDDFFHEMLCTIAIKDYENVCMQYIENQGYIVTDILERNEKSIYIKASEESRNIIFACSQESKNMVDDELLHNISSKENVESLEKIIVIGVENSVSIADRKVETISCEQFLNALKNQGIIDDEGINLKVGLIPPDKKAILNDVYGYMKEKYLENKREINAQLAFMEVLSETLLNAWFRNEDEYFIKELLDEYFDVEKEIAVININIQYMLLFVRANLLCLVGEVKETIKLYRKLLEWKMLTNSIVYENGLEDMYLAVVYNLYQFLLIENCNKEAEEIYQKHNKIIQYGLDSCMEQVEYGVDTNDEKFRREWQRAYNIISGGKIGEIYVLSGLDGYVISAIHTSNGYRSMIFENLKNIKDIGSKESVYLDVWIDMVDLEQREDEYYVKKKDGMKKWNLH